MRHIPNNKAVCSVCDGIYGFTPGVSKDYIGRRKPTPSVIHTHGPVKKRCEGSRKPIVPWIDAVGLPKWEDMSNLDRGSALRFVWKIHWERCYHYAKKNYPCIYWDNKDLASLCTDDACRHARIVTGGYKIISERLGEDEFLHLYNLGISNTTSLSRLERLLSREANES